MARLRNCRVRLIRISVALALSLAVSLAAVPPVYAMGTDSSQIVETVFSVADSSDMGMILENKYRFVQQGYTLSAYTGKELCFEVADVVENGNVSQADGRTAVFISQGTSASFRIQVPQSGSYCLRIAYYEADDGILSTKLGISVKKASTDTGASTSVNLLNKEKLGQVWRLDDVTEDSCVICNVNSGKVLQAKDCSRAARAEIIQDDYVKDADAQKWRFEKVADSGKEIPTLLPVAGATEHSSCPEIVRYGDTYYMYIMAPGISIKMSTDLINWTFVQTAFPTGGSGLPYEWMNEEIPGGGIWAPGVYKIGELYYLYYCISTGGSQNSAIGVAVNTTLDHTSPDFKWQDKGMVLRSKTGDSFNAIDPNVIVDDNGQAWLVYGSWWTGVKMRRLDNNTGKLDPNDTTVYDLARYAADSSKNAIEAPS